MELSCDEKLQILEILQKTSEQLANTDSCGEWFHLYRVINCMENVQMFQEALSFDIKIFVDQWPKFNVICIVFFKDHEYFIMPYMEPYQEINKYENHMENMLSYLFSHHVESNGIRSVVFGGISSYLYDPLKKLFPVHCIQNSTTAFWLSHSFDYTEEQLSVSVHTDRRLYLNANFSQSSDFEVFCHNWKYICYWNKTDLKLIIGNLPAVFMYQDDILVGHFVSIIHGTCGALYVDEKLRKHGFGGLLIRNLAVNCKHRNRRILIEVEDYNILSYELFKKQGFLPACRTYYVQINSKNRNLIS